MKKLENGDVLLTREEYEKLDRDSLFVAALENSGVDNWTWYGEACDLYCEYLKETGYEET